MLKRIGAEEGGEFKAVASGTLPSGKPVVVNADGTVSVVVETSSSESLGSDVTFNAASTSWVANAFDSTNNKVVVAYSDGGNSSYGHARVGTVDSSNNSISWGTEVTFRSSASQYISACFDSANGKIVIAYQDQGDSFKGKAIIGTVSGTDISFGSSVEFQSGETTYINAVYDTSTSKVVIVYRNSSGTGKAIVGTVSGTSISFGSAVSTGHGALQGTAVYHAAASRIVAAGKVDNSTANAVVGAVSGTSISFGSAVAYGTSSAAKNNNKMGYDSASEKVVVFYRDEGDSSDGKASVGTVDSSDNSISFATAVTVTTDTVDMVGVQGFSSGGQIIFLYSDTDNTKGDLKVGTISGTTLSVGSELNVRNGGNTNYWGLCEDTTNDRIVIAYEGASSHGISNVYNPAFSITNITSENYIGMSRGVVTGEAGSTGTAVSFESGTTTLSHVAFDSSNNKVVIAYQDASNSDKGKAIVGTVSGTSISFGSEVVFEAGGTANIDCVFDSDSNKVVIVYSDAGDSGRSKGIVGTVSGTSISFGSPTQFNSGANYAYNVAAAFDNSNNKVVVAYRDSGNSSYGTAAVGTVSGTSISFGTPVVYESANSSQNAVVFDSSNNKVVIGFKDEGNSSHGTAIVGTVSGTSISFGSAVVFNAGETSQLVGTFDSSNNKVVFAYRDNGNSDQGTAIVGTVSGTSISFGSEVIFNAANTQGTSAVFDTNANKVVISYEDRGDSDKGKFIVGTVSGTSISFDTETGFSGSNAVYQTGAAFDSNANKVVIAYANDTDSSDRGEAIVTNIDSISRAEVANSGNASMDIIGSVSDNQIGLTTGQQYFVQTDGTIGTTAGDPSVLAGTAISATELVVKT